MTQMFSFSVGTNVYTVEEPDVDLNKWLVIAEEKYRPDKGKFVLEEFKKVYPSIKVSDVDQVYKLASRSANLNEWLAKTNIKYAVIEGAPTYFREFIDPTDFDNASKEVLKISSSLAEKAKEQATAAANYKNALAEIDKKYEKKLNTSDKFAKILSLNTTKLPLSIQLAIENYTPATSSSPNMKAFARECLVSYKIELIKALSKDKNIDLDKLIEDNMEK